ncbi:MAG: acyl-CoA dehydrogenase family protein [Acidimicrobiales bacterium]
MSLLYELTDEQRELRDVVRRLLADRPAARGPYDGGPLGPDLDLWKVLVEVGVAGLGIPEELGGGDGDVVDLAVVAEELGRAVAPVPFVSGAVSAAGLLLAPEGDERDRWLAGLADGSVVGAAVLEDGPLVYDAAGATLLVVVDEDSVGVLARPALEVLPSVDRTRPVARWGRVAASSLTNHRVDVDVLHHLRATLYAAEAVGVAADALDRTAAHARERRQFGHPIGTFQAVKHRLADMLVAVESSRSAVYAAAWALRSGAPAQRRLAVHMAQAVATDAATKVVSAAIQLHGGIGVTWEHDLHLRLRRAKALELTCGAPAWHYGEIARTLLGPVRETT